MDKVLVIAPHPDDEVLGVGGTIAKLAQAGHEVTIAIPTGQDDSHPIFTKQNCDTVRAEAKVAHKLLGVKETIFEDIPPVLLPDLPVHEVNKVIHKIISDVSPDVLFIPYLYDIHKDHRELAYACSVAWRPVSEFARNIRDIYMYETLSETHWNIQPQEPGFLPNTFFDISGEFLSKKLSAMSEFKSQVRPFPDCRSLEALEALAKLRGSMVGLHAAEAFILVRSIQKR